MIYNKLIIGLFESKLILCLCFFIIIILGYYLVIYKKKEGFITEDDLEAAEIQALRNHYGQTYSGSTQALSYDGLNDRPETREEMCLMTGKDEYCKEDDFDWQFYSHCKAAEKEDPSGSSDAQFVDECMIKADVSLILLDPPVPNTNFIPSDPNHIAARACDEKEESSEAHGANFNYTGNSKDIYGKRHPKLTNTWHSMNGVSDVYTDRAEAVEYCNTVPKNQRQKCKNVSGYDLWYDQGCNDGYGCYFSKVDVGCLSDGKRGILNVNTSDDTALINKSILAGCKASSDWGKANWYKLKPDHVGTTDEITDKYFKPVIVNNIEEASSVIDRMKRYVGVNRVGKWAENVESSYKESDCPGNPCIWVNPHWVRVIKNKEDVVDGDGSYPRDAGNEKGYCRKFFTNQGKMDKVIRCRKASSTHGAHWPSDNWGENGMDCGQNGCIWVGESGGGYWVKNNVDSDNLVYKFTDAVDYCENKFSIFGEQIDCINSARKKVKCGNLWRNIESGLPQTSPAAKEDAKYIAAAHEFWDFLKE